MLNKNILSFEQPQVMGILNLTPDSFYDGNRYIESYLKQTEKMLDEGADIIDIGAMSSRPGSVEITVEEEIDRLQRPIKEIRKTFPKAILSLDTYRYEVAMKFWNEGVDIINDISAGVFDEKMLPFINEKSVPYVMMHMQGIPQTMQIKPHYNDILEEIKAFFVTQLTQLQDSKANIILDPGFGFGKRVKDNYLLLRRLEEFKALGYPILVGLSRKSMIHKLLRTTPEEALNGTTAAHTIALLNKADILRVHDVKEAKEVINIVKEIL